MPQPRQVPQEQPAPREEVASLLLEDFAKDTLLVAESTASQAKNWPEIDPQHLRVSINGGDDIVMLDPTQVDELVAFLANWLGWTP